MNILKKHEYILLSIVVLSVACTSKSTTTSYNENLPNIVFILVDDLGWSDLAFMGNPVYETPNLDKLSKEAAVFTTAYAPAANCAPSRASILTGKNTPTHGIYTVGSSERGKSKNRKLIPTPNTKVLADEFITLSEVLKERGYVSTSIGKWHIGEDPRSQGFDFNIGGTDAGHPKSYFSPYKNEKLPNGEEGEYLTDRLTSEAIRFIETNKASPFFLYLPYFTVHTPLQGKIHTIAKYENKVNGNIRYNAKFGAMVESMDENVGRLLKSLKDLKLDENTLIIFTSDNGGLAHVSSQFPLRAGKGSYYEGGIRVPFMVKWGTKIKPSTIDDPITGLDIFPTITDIIKDNKDYQLDGVSLLSLLSENKRLEERALFWHFPIYLQGVNPKKDQARDTLFRIRPGSVIRKGKWKLHHYFEDNAIELYNLEKDLFESKNLVEKYPNRVKILYKELEDWRAKIKAPIPNKLNPDFQ
ncbi:sulfatase [Pontimicrobium sp. SW4]|uniref:Sulfatase n=1 Tax=Pontimicrobium sp. SW4 TaxID=3153519 RepID=A0AAU7BWA8_9FLAO